jgi:hypothetical protein
MEWWADHKEWLLKSHECEGEVLEEQTHWCEWLKKNLDDIIKKFATHLAEEDQLPLSSEQLKEKWDKWLNNEMFSLVEEWQEDWNYDRKYN